ncbi:hypothetical protein PVAG01_00294 [Phlyctema vagabunda]|uniref:C2H2-type domain-containing protein n=1 Tax=Phlyctema vagabunda TaxID=108571 RepID=A0ABR4PU69_9HELO
MVIHLIDAPSSWSTNECFSGSKRSRMSSGQVPTSVTCSKGHVHPPWNTTGVLRIAKCESVCGFCQRETKTAANLRKHVAIHIKNEGLNLTVAEGSSGRGRIEMSSTILNQDISSSRMSSVDSERSSELQTRQSTQFNKTAWTGRIGADDVSNPATTSRTHLMRAISTPNPASSNATTTPSSLYSSSHADMQPFFNGAAAASNDPFRALKDRNLATKPAWTVIPAAEGFRILDLCKNLSVIGEHDPASGAGGVPCYNRETIFDEEWQAHMKDVHGVFLLWPETWMRRIEVLDLDPYGGDIGVCNEIIMNVHD